MKLLTEQLIKAVGEQIDLRQEGVNSFYVSTPFRYEDGDHFEIYLKVSNGKLILTDDGLTLMKLSYDVDYDSPARNKVIERVLATDGIKNEDGVLSLETSPETLGAAFLSFVEAIIRISDVAFLKKEIVRSVFFEEFRSFIEQTVKERKIYFSHNFPEIDPRATYPIDCVLQNGKKPLFAFAITNDDKCKDATITILHYELEKFDFKSMAVFEDQETISRNVLARLTDVCDRQFSNLSGNKDRILDFIIQMT